MKTTSLQEKECRVHMPSQTHVGGCAQVSGPEWEQGQRGASCQGAVTESNDAE